MPVVRKLKVIPVILFIYCIFNILQADIPWQVGGESSGDHLEISLVTIDPGDELTMWWGHTAVIVRDTLRDVSRFYNYGLFTFEQDNFVLNFIQGRLIFWVGDWDVSGALRYYQSLNRSIRIQYLNLTPQKRLEMAHFLAQNVLPQNREYLYDHYRDNCATRVRDLIDKIVDGQFFEATQDRGRMTLREHTRRHTYQNPIMDWVLMFLMSDTIDEPIRQWDEMFLPTELERYLSNFNYINENDSTISLISRTEIFFQAVNRDPVPEKAPSHTPWFFAASIFLSVIILLSSKFKKGSNIFNGIIYLLFGIIFGLMGLVLFVLSQFTDHTVTFGNENLFYANPLTFLLLFAGVGFFHRWPDISSRVRSFIYFLSLIGWSGLILKLLFNFDQDNWLAIATILPVLTTFSVYWFLNFSNKRE
jgi:hypothetical protein